MECQGTRDLYPDVLQDEERVEEHAAGKLDCWRGVEVYYVGEVGLHVIFLEPCVQPTAGVGGVWRSQGG